ncbi:hypothetical protein CHARACLAT_032954 [Characodon lateralis]|uniref:Tubulin epsilon and delta complex protein 1 domain-containing protein n=1 Tax=Characodon lateralis TaxID=208331 RepID=A0ABU7F806_9TELE|nr:hypothetical protein [Characodon lateralis]
MSGIISSETSSQLSGERRKLVAVGLWQSGYYGDWIYGTDGGSFSSRDLLLALGWLLAKGALEKMLTGRVEQLDRTLLPSAPEKREFSGELELDAASLRRLQWLMGHLRHQRRTLLSTIGVRTRVLHDVRRSFIQPLQETAKHPSLCPLGGSKRCHATKNQGSYSQRILGLKVAPRVEFSLSKRSYSQSTLGLRAPNKRRC